MCAPIRSGLFDGTVEDVFLQAANNRTATVARCWYQSATISNIVFWKGCWSDPIGGHIQNYERHIEIRYRNSCTWSNVYSGASDGVWVDVPNTKIKFGGVNSEPHWIKGKNFDTPVIATAIRITGFGGSNNPYKYCKEIYVYGELIFPGTLIVIK